MQHVLVSLGDDLRRCQCENGLSRLFGGGIVCFCHNTFILSYYFQKVNKVMSLGPLAGQFHVVTPLA